VPVSHHTRLTVQQTRCQCLGDELRKWPSYLVQRSRQHPTFAYLESRTRPTLQACRLVFVQQSFDSLAQRSFWTPIQVFLQRTFDEMSIISRNACGRALCDRSGLAGVKLRRSGLMEMLLGFQLSAHSRTRLPGPRRVRKSSLAFWKAQARSVAGTRATNNTRKSRRRAWSSSISTRSMTRYEGEPWE
jgi:hypothetical protein